MSLVDPKNPLRWADGSKRSTDNGFVLGFLGVPVDWSFMQRAARLRKASTRNVEAARVQGKDRSSIFGLSKKADDRLATRRNFAVEGREAGQRSTDKRAALKRGGI